MKIGINKMSFYVPKYYLDLETLANARGIDPLKYTNGLLTNKMSISPFNQDIISLAANATLNYLTKEDIEDIDLVLFTTESGIDYSKSAATHLISILGLRNDVRAVEMKQACYATTAALYFAKGHILQSPKSKVLVIASDIAKYGLNSSGEPTQGAGAVSMIISSNPQIMILEDNYGIHAEDVYDFWRPDRLDYAQVDGRFSNEMYKKFFLNTFDSYTSKTKHTINDFSALAFHIPYAKIGLRSLELVAKNQEHLKLFENFHTSIQYNKEVGNIYTGSLFLSVISLLEQGNLKAGERVGMFGYGSGAVAEFFAATLVEGYKDHLNKDLHENQLSSRIALDMTTYASYLVDKVTNGTTLENDLDVKVQLKSIIDYKRLYIKN